ncbi:MAG: hypothetical protein ACRD4X_08070 [Candidatus Acidiferrales bacterium]
MSAAPIETIQQANRDLRVCLRVLSNSPDPVNQRSRAIEEMSQILRDVDRAVQSAPRETLSGQEWRTHIASYTDTLRALRAKLVDVEAALRVRSTQLANARARAGAVGAWASLARHIG